MTDHPVVVVNQPGRTPIFLSIQQPIVLGRDCDGCVLVDPQVSRSHLRLEARSGVVLVTDMGSTNGTFLAGQRLTMPTVLATGAEIVLGETRLTLQTARSADTTVVPAQARSTVVAGSEETGSGGAVMPLRAAAADWTRQTSIDIVAAAVREERPDLSAMQDDAGTVTIAFSDIESSTEHNLAIGDQAWMKVLDDHNRLVRRHVAAFGGSEIKSQGDGFMLSFPGARRAVLAMIEIQRELAQRERDDPDTAVRVRMGCHTGEVIVDDAGDLFGKHVIVAARIANQAAGGEILVSALVKDLVTARGDIEFGETRVVDLKGIEGQWDVHAVEWDRAPLDAG